MMMTHLPIDVIFDILSRLPAKTLVCLKIVCKSWYELIGDDYFVNYHLERSLTAKTNLHYVVTTPRMYFQHYDHLPKPHRQSCPVLYTADFDSLANPLELSHPFKNCNTGVWVLGSCRGLLLLRVGGTDLLLYNPTTQTYNELPFLPKWEYTHCDFGFGYDSVLKDYKCVRIMQFLHSETGFLFCEVMVYSMKTNCWKRVCDVPCYFRTYNWCISVLLHEICHWIGVNSNEAYEFVVGFSLKDETFSCLPLPDLQFQYSDGLFVGLGMLDGCLCLLANRYLHCNVWVMKEYGVAGSWTKVFCFEKDHCENLERPIYSLDKKRLMFVKTICSLVYIDLETMEHTNVMFADWDRGLDAHVYVENLLMLDYAEFAADIRSRKEQQGQRKKKNRRRRKNKT